MQSSDSTDPPLRQSQARLLEPVRLCSRARHQPKPRQLSHGVAEDCQPRPGNHQHADIHTARLR